MIDNIVAVLENLRAAVGNTVFDAAIVKLNGAPPVVAEVKEKKPRKVDPEKTAIRKSEMANLAAYTAWKRTSMPEGTPYKEVQVAAGAEWKALGLTEKAAWIGANVTTEKECVVKVTQSEPKQTVVAVKDGEKKGRGRPKKSA
jgi:hypothetical protein